jgi:hypothetical protein
MAEPQTIPADTIKKPLTPAVLRRFNLALRHCGTLGTKQSRREC